MSTYNICLRRQEKVYNISAEAGEDLLTVLQKNNIYISAACGGRGKCGKCRIRFTEGATDAMEDDKVFFSEEELKKGYRLACLSKPQSDCSIELDVADESDFEVVTDSLKEEASVVRQENTESDGICSIAIDIGTTTIAISLVEKNSGRVLDTVTSVNHQRFYGADVISRIQAANEGKLSELSASIRKDLGQGILKLIDKYGKDIRKIEKISIAGNTTMGHLLMGYSCQTLGVVPFTPVNIGIIESGFNKLFGRESRKLEEDIPVVLLPGISTYVGADITAGMLCNNFDTNDKICVLIDLGTNGEMAIGNRDRIMVTSTAAGPAFEGGNISCGVGSIKGAICHVSIENGQVSLETIGNDSPTGICGTGVIETVCELLKNDLIDETGMLDEDYFDDGFVLGKKADGEEISFTQADVREIQLAKSAVRAGFETLLKRYGAGYEDIDTLYLAGGFGYKIDRAKAAAIGMLPQELLPKIKAVGNSSLAGAIEFITEADVRIRCEKIAGLSEEISLATDKDFNRMYTEYMFFE